VKDATESAREPPPEVCSSAPLQFLFHRLAGHAIGPITGSKALLKNSPPNEQSDSWHGSGARFQHGGSFRLGEEVVANDDDWWAHPHPPPASMFEDERPGWFLGELEPFRFPIQDERLSVESRRPGSEAAKPPRLFLQMIALTSDARFR
jgi:hypothetical protein